MKILKILLITLLIILVSGSSNSQFLKDFNLHKNNSAIGDSNRHVQFKNVKSPVLAGVLSFVVPGIGLGQVYNGEYIKSIIHTSVSAACLLTVLIAGANGSIKINIVDSGPSKGVGYLIIPFLAYVINWTYSVVDAVISANRINRKAKYLKYNSDVMNNLRFGLTFNKNKQLHLKFAFEL